ncbi:MAG: hypothetical protein AAGF83_16520 [Cyanobacteria bacterium P01_G01_bin.67]
MDYLTSDKNTLVWLCFSIYAVTALFLVPNRIKFDSQTTNVNHSDDRELQFASRLVLRLVLIFPMLALLRNAI